MTNMNRLMLIGCSKTKKACEYDSRVGGRVVPEQLYGSQLFSKRVEYANAKNLRWYVLSARYGVWRPTIGMKPYDQTFADMTPADIAAWHSSCALWLLEELWEPFHQKESAEPLKPSELTIEVHAGADYCHPLAEILKSVGIVVELPLAGLGIGEQLAWYCQAKPVEKKLWKQRRKVSHVAAIDGADSADRPGQEDRETVVCGGPKSGDLFWASGSGGSEAVL
jgi:hypothetical protein